MSLTPPHGKPHGGVCSLQHHRTSTGTKNCTGSEIGQQRSLIKQLHFDLIDFFISLNCI